VWHGFSTPQPDSQIDIHRFSKSTLGIAEIEGVYVCFREPGRQRQDTNPFGIPAIVPRPRRSVNLMTNLSQSICSKRIGVCVGRRLVVVEYD